MVFSSGLGAPETPRSLADNSWLLVEMAPDRGCITRISADGSARQVIARTGRPNGLVVDYTGIIWVAETHPRPALMRATMDGDASVFIEDCDEGHFLFPNDLCFGRDGALYMTDSGILFSEWVVDGSVRSDYATAGYDGRVYRIDLAKRLVTTIDAGLKFPNGIAIGPDGHLYVNEMITGAIYRYTLRDDLPTGKREVFGNVMASGWRGGFRGPDGMAFGMDGHLYCTVYGQGTVTILNGEGIVTGHLRTLGTQPTNLAFGPDKERRLYVTEAERGQIEVHEVSTAGFPLYDGAPVH